MNVRHHSPFGEEMPGLRTVFWLFVGVARASHEWSSGAISDQAASDEQASRLELSGTYAKSYTHWATELRAHLLETYDKGVPPTSNRNLYNTCCVATTRKE